MRAADATMKRGGERKEGEGVCVCESRGGRGGEREMIHLIERIKKHIQWELPKENCNAVRKKIEKSGPDSMDPINGLSMLLVSTIVAKKQILTLKL